MKEKARDYHSEDGGEEKSPSAEELKAEIERDEGHEGRYAQFLAEDARLKRLSE